MRETGTPQLFARFLPGFRLSGLDCFQSKKQRARAAARACTSTNNTKRALLFVYTKGFSPGPAGLEAHQQPQARASGGEVNRAELIRRGRSKGGGGCAQLERRGF